MFHGVRPLVLALLGLCAGLPVFAQSIHPPVRLALVIGNADYAVAPLPTAANDAGLIATTLAQAGFDVTAAANANAATLRNLVQTFAGKVQAKAGPDTVVVTYISGYGLQANGENGLVPIDAQITRDVDVPAATLELSDLCRVLDALPAKARIYIYDLARDTPFAKAGAPLASGLSLVEAKPGSLIAFNTAPGTVAPADIATYGIYARTLAELLGTPGLPMAILFDQLRLRVAQITNGSTIPWDDSQLDPAFALDRSAQPPDSPQLGERAIAGLSSDVGLFLTLARDQLDGYVEDLAAFPGDPLVNRVATLTAVRREALIWAACVKSNEPAAYWTYMRRYPRGPHLLDARRRLAAIHNALEPPPRFDLVDFGALGLPSPDELAILARHPMTLDDPDWTPLPPMPDGLIPPAGPDEIDLSVPPLAMPGSLPLPMPLEGVGSGTVTQSFVPGQKEFISRFSIDAGRTTIMETLSGGALVSRTHARREADRRIVTQRDAQDAIISRTTTTFATDLVTSVQTGPTGGILRKVVTRTDASGDHTMTMSNGRNQIIATVHRDKSGMVTSMERGAAPVRDDTIVFKPGTGHDLTGPEPKVGTVSPSEKSVSAVVSQPAALKPPIPPPELKVEAPPPPPPPTPGNQPAATSATPAPPPRASVRPNLKKHAPPVRARAEKHRNAVHRGVARLHGHHR